MYTVYSGNADLFLQLHRFSSLINRRFETGKTFDPHGRDLPARMVESILIIQNTSAFLLCISSAKIATFLCVCLL